MPKKIVLTRPKRAPTTLTGLRDVGGGPPSPSKEGRRGPGPSGRPEGAEKKSKLQQALALVNQFEEPELKVLYEATALRLHDLWEAGSGGDRDLGMWSTAAYEALASEIGGGAGGMAGPMAVRRLLAARTSWAPVRDFVAQVDLKVADRLAFYRLLAKLLVEHCARLAKFARAPLGPKLVANNTAQLAALFEQAFPGYVVGGLLPMLLHRLTSGEGSPGEDDDDEN